MVIYRFPTCWWNPKSVNNKNKNTAVKLEILKLPIQLNINPVGYILHLKYYILA